MILRYIFFLILIGSGSAVHAAVGLDSLLLVLGKHDLDAEERMTTLLEICKVYRDEDPNKILSYAKASQDLINVANITNDTLIAESLCFYAFGLERAGRISEAVEHFEKLVSGDINCPVYIYPRAYGYLGNIFCDKGILDKSLTYYLKSLSYSKKMDDWSVTNANLINIGNLYLDVDLDDKAKEYFEQVLEVSRTHDLPLDRDYALGNLGVILVKQGDLSEGLAYHKEALKNFEADGDSYGFITGLRQVAETYMLMDSFELAWEYADKAYKQASESESQTEKLVAAITLAKALIAYKKDDQVMPFINRSLSQAEEMKLFGVQAELSLIKSECLEKMGFWKEALQARKSFEDAADTLTAKEAAETFAELSFRFETEKKEAENLFLKDRHQKQETIIRQRTLIAAASCLTLILAAIVGWILMRQSRRRQQYGILLEQQVKERTETLQKSNLLLKRKNDALRSFAYITSHDLREPVLKIGMAAEAIESNLNFGETETNTRCLKIIKEGAAFLDLLVKSIKHFTQAAVENPKIVSLDIKIAIDLAKRNLNDYIAGRNATIDSDYTSLLVKVDFPAAQLVAIFQNLLQNGIKYNKSRNPLIRIWSEEFGDKVKICVGDNGVGVDPVFHEEIFQPFKTMESKSEHESAGLGLATCKAIIENNGGRIWLEHNQEGGSTFCFTLPRSKVQADVMPKHALA